MKMQTPFLYADPEIETVQVKYFRIGHYTRSGNIYDYSDGSSVSPHFIWDTKLSTWGWFSLHSYRSGPNYEYILNPNDPEVYWPTAVNTFGDITDGQWHKMVFYVKMNTQNLDGSWNSDGINRFWFDDSLILEETSIPWMESGVARPWNYVAFGGNQDNVFTDTTSGDEQWYAIDDVVISTEPIPDDYIIGGGTSTITRADVDNNSTINTTDAMLTLRNSLGLNMSNTNWFSSATTGDVNCDNVSNSTDAMLILRHSLGLDMSGTGWCE
jgi:phage gp37-like protein